MRRKKQQFTYEGYDDAATREETPKRNSSCEMVDTEEMSIEERFTRIEGTYKSAGFRCDFPNVAEKAALARLCIDFHCALNDKEIGDEL